MEAQASSWRDRLLELVTHPSEHAGLWLAVFAVLLLLSVAARKR